MTSPLVGHVLSIQSHVVHGHVGNDAAVFPLQLHHYEVDAIHSVQFSNHTQYQHVRGGKLKEADLLALYEGLQLNNLTKSYTHVLTGYIGDITFLHGIAHVIDDLKKQNKDLLYMCDPVLGDHGRLYVPQELVQAFKTVLIPRADIITPNHFETSLLTDTPLDDILKHKFDVIELLDKMHAMGPRTVIITGIPSLDQSTITLYASKYEQQSNDKNEEEEKRSIYQVQFPKLNSFFTGTGDLIASLLLANMRQDVPFAKQLERAVASVQHVLKYTAEQGGGELRLVECWPGIVSPQVDAYHAEPVQLPSTIN